MKKAVHLFQFLMVPLCASMLVAITPLRAQNLKEPGAYMKYIGDQQREIMKDIMSYTSAVAHGKSARKVENRRKEMIQSVTEARKKISTMPPFESDKTYRDSTARYLMIAYHVLNDDYGKIVNLEEVAEQSYDGMGAYLLAQDMASNKLNIAADNLQKMEKTFASNHKINLIETQDELSLKLAVAKKVNEYHRMLYLIFFKSFKQEVYLIDAVQNKNVNAVEQSKNTLATYAAEGIAKLDTMKTFAGDKSMITATRQLLDFYRKECKDHVPVLTNYFIKEENFNKIKKAFDAKREKDRTQADVNQFNNAVNEMNKGVKEYNTTNNQLNATRNQLINNWNKTSEDFLDKHTPKYK